MVMAVMHGGRRPPALRMHVIMLVGRIHWRVCVQRRPQRLCPRKRKQENCNGENKDPSLVHLSMRAHKITKHLGRRRLDRGRQPRNRTGLRPPDDGAIRFDQRHASYLPETRGWTPPQQPS
jgi:hypothetical protein